MAYMDLFDKEARADADKLLDYYDGESKEHLMAFLQMHRKNAIKKGMVPRVRNLVKMIVDKSGLLFSGKPPVIEVYTGVGAASDVDEAESAKAQTIFESANWIEFFQNLDSALRLLKTVYVLVQVDPASKRFRFFLLSQENAAVEQNEFGDVTTLVYELKEMGEDCIYRVWNETEYFNLRVDKAGNESREPGTTFPNPYGGMIPIAAFHDLNVPREDAWNPMQMDLVEINDIYNLHITDSEFSSMWIKQPTLFTDAKIQGGTGVTYSAVQEYEDKLPRWIPTSEPGFVGGPGTIVAVETVSDRAPYLEMKGPQVPLGELDTVVKNWVIDFAQDWSVSISAEGNGNADSGFKLVVKELPNLELRRARARQMESGFKRLYEVIKAVAGSVGIALNPEGTLFIDFGNPDLPIDEKANEEVWSRKIAEKRASRIDYFMEVKGMSRAEAEAKIAEIDAEAPISKNLPTPTSVQTTAVTV